MFLSNLKRFCGIHNQLVERRSRFVGTFFRARERAKNVEVHEPGIDEIVLGTADVPATSVPSKVACDDLLNDFFSRIVRRAIFASGLFGSYLSSSHCAGSY